MPQKRKAQAEQDETDLSKKTSRSRSQTHGFDQLPISKVYRLIEPGPVLMVTTGSLDDSTHSVMTIGFHMVMQHESPPLFGITLGPWDASFAVLKKQRECVPSVEMADVVVDVGNCSADDYNYDGDGDGAAKINGSALD